jgi:hypothetical protein
MPVHVSSFGTNHGWLIGEKNLVTQSGRLSIRIRTFLCAGTTNPNGTVAERVHEFVFALFVLLYVTHLVVGLALELNRLDMLAICNQDLPRNWISVRFISSPPLSLLTVTAT